MSPKPTKPQRKKKNRQDHQWQHHFLNRSGVTAIICQFGSTHICPLLKSYVWTAAGVAPATSVRFHQPPPSA